MTVLHMDCIEGMKLFPDAYFDSIVTDPPYELGFMGKAWDASGIANNVEMWREALRVLKPGGHLLAFSGSRTYHRMVCAIEDAGFEIRDQIMWVYGSGFPKSLDVSKAIDKAAGATREVVGVQRTNVGMQGGNFTAGSQTGEVPITVAATEEARTWNGWGTALKPAHEPIVVARKPLVGTVAANVLAHGTGALNIDGCRVDGPGGVKWETPRGGIWATDAAASAKLVQNDLGRWPANLIHDGSDEVVALFPAQAGAAAPVKGTEESAASEGRVTGQRDRVPGAFHADTGSAARFFYCAKASKSDRSPDNNHPTVKPTELMRYLCRLVTPPGGLVLDPFAGSGSTGKACALEGFQFLGFELDESYAAIAAARIEEARRHAAPVGN